MIRKVKRRPSGAATPVRLVSMEKAPTTYAEARAQYERLLAIELKATSGLLLTTRALKAAKRHSERTNTAIRLMGAHERLEATPVISNVRQDGNILNHGQRPDGRPACGVPIYQDQGGDGCQINCHSCHRILLNKYLKAQG